LSTYAIDTRKSVWHPRQTLPTTKIPNPDPDSPGDLLHLIRSGRARTRGELGQVTGLARSTVAQRIDALKTAGLIVELDEAAPSTGGRPPSLLGFNAEAGLILAADLGAHHSKVSVSNLLAEPIADVTAEIDIDLGPIEVLAWLDQAFRGLLVEIGRPISEVRGIGIGLPGPVDFAHGMAVNPPIMAGWHMFSVAEHFRGLYEVPVLVDNDVNIMALGEYWVMEPKVEDFLFIKVGTGIGSGLILGGRLHRGAMGAAGDIGHIQTTSDDAICRCGNYGCLEATAGGGAIAAHLRELGYDTSYARDVAKLVQEGNREATQRVRAAGRLIGQVLASTVNLLNPALIMVGGDMAKAESQLLAGIREVVYQRSTTLSTINLQLTVSSLGDLAGVTGAAAMVIEHIFAPSAIDHALADR
jgi:predicted NBD/HSP70 family sugar kinase